MILMNGRAGAIPAQLKKYDVGTVSSGVARALTGWATVGLVVAVPGIPNMEATLAIKEPTGAHIGTLTLHSGSHGTNFLDDGTEADMQQFVTDVLAAGYRVVQIAFGSAVGTGGWSKSTAGGQNFGPGQYAGRVATILKYIHNTYAPGDLYFGCFGNSGGGSQICYALGFYGMGGIIDFAIVSGGPPHAGMYDAGPDPAWWSDQNPDKTYDEAYGYLSPNWGPAYADDESFRPTWWRDSLDTGAINLDWPKTDVFFILGSSDNSGALRAGRYFWLDRMRRGYSIYNEVQAPHSIEKSIAALDVISQHINGEPVQIQELQQDSGGITGTHQGKTFKPLDHAGLAYTPTNHDTLLFAIWRPKTSLANTVDPAEQGWNVEHKYEFATGTGCLYFMWKWGEGETEVFFDVTVACPYQLYVAEWSIMKAQLAADPDYDEATDLTANLGPTPTLAPRGLAVAYISIAGNNTGFNNDWAGGFTREYVSSGANPSLEIATKVILAPDAGVATQASYTSSPAREMTSGLFIFQDNPRRLPFPYRLR